jgi:hypothetical protein
MADFAEVLQHELELIERRRSKLVEQAKGEPTAGGLRAAPHLERREGARRVAATVVPDRSAEWAESAEERGRLRALDLHLVGLAISGGGIRSATFALGVLQAVAHFKLLRRIDYLSTVSGGGYIGSWLSAWLRREQSVANVELQLAPSRVDESDAARRPLPPGFVVDDEPETIHHLRAYSDYLAPRPGLLSPDTWTILAIYFRNILINLLMLLPATVGFLLATRLVVVRSYMLVLAGVPEDAPAVACAALIGLVVAIGLLVLAFRVNATALAELRRVDALDAPDARPAAPGRAEPKPRRLTEAEFVRRIVAPIVLAAVLGGWAFLELMRLREIYRVWHPGADGDANAAWTPTTWWLVVGFILLSGLVTVAMHASTPESPGGPDRRKLGFAALLAGLLGGAHFSVSLVWLRFIVSDLQDALAPALATIVPPLALLAVVVAFLTEVAVLGREIREAEREWWARLSAWLLAAAVAWPTFFGCQLFVPALLIRFDSALFSTGILTSWIATTLGGVLAGRSPRTKDLSGTPWLEWLGVIAPHVFLAGLFTGVSFLVAYLVNDPVPSFFNAEPPELLSRYWRGFVAARESLLFWWMVASLAFAGLMARMVNVNLFSLNNMYANRLIRCYLGASRPKPSWRSRFRAGTWVAGEGGAPTGASGPERQQNLVTGFDPNDDIPLRDLAICSPLRPTDCAGSRPSGGHDQDSYVGPFHIINTALNLVAGRELAWRDRKAESFILTPVYSGSESTGYARMRVETAPRLTLGRAVAISGAAVDPNMNYHQSPSLTALMTVFNARLGWWIQNPARPGWCGGGPSHNDLLYSELFGRTDDLGDYVHLSDGGHFENLGIYELVRRRCRYIIAVEAPSDRGAATDSLANMIRLCRIDFGVRIDLDTAPLEATGPHGLSRWHCAIGTIHYEDVDHGELPGILVYVRASMTGDEPADLREYADKNPGFPFQSTADQFFDEAQFESYRALGYHAATHVFQDALKELGLLFPQRPSVDPDQAFIQENRALFSELRRRWFPPIADPDRAIEQVSREWLEIQERFRDTRPLQGLVHELIPELRPASAEVDRATAADAAGRRRGTGPRVASGSPGDERRVAEVATVGQMLQVMENAWSALRMESHHNHPMHRGWMNVFRRWSSSDTFQALWPIYRGQFNRDFVGFCEEELRLRPPKTEHVLTADLTAPLLEQAVSFLEHAFEREWPALTDAAASGTTSRAGRTRGLRGLIKDAGRLPLAKPAAWVIIQELMIPRSGVEHFPCGIVLARQDPHARQDIEFLAWMLPAYRGLGIGRSHVGEILKSLCKELVNKPRGRRDVTLSVRFPSRGFERDVRQTLWMSFFYHYDFRPPRARRPLPGEDLVLKACYSYNKAADRLESRRLG